MTLMTDLKLVDPGPEVELRFGDVRRFVRWGHAWQVGSAAYWIAATRDADATGPLDHRLGSNLREEVAVCLLGGFGMPFELGLAAFESVRSTLMRDHRAPSAEAIEAVLREPLLVGGRLRRYRFPHQRAVRLAGALAWVDGSIDSTPVGARAIRDWLLDAPGIGMKTASWIVRNHFDAPDVAILDIHVVRAGVRSGVFPESLTVTRDYRLLESLFLAWAARGAVRAADLDAVIWAEQAFWARHS